MQRRFPRQHPVLQLEVRLNFTPLVFTPPTLYTAGTYPSDVVTADLARTGHQDVIASDFGSSSISVLMGNGDGTLQPAVSYAVGAQPESVAVGDFNGDGIPDIVTANEGDDTISVLLGNGDGTFQPAVDYPTGVQPENVAVADLENNGIDDIVTADSGSNTVSIFLNPGNGLFGAAEQFVVGTNPDSLAVADINGDQLPDIITTHPTNNSVHVLLNEGNGQFGSLTAYDTGTYPRAVAVTDINNDGEPDLITANLTGGDISVLHGLGAGVFDVHNEAVVGSAPFAMTVLDANGDGRMDIAVVNNFDNDIGVLLRSSTQGFVDQQIYRAGKGSAPVAITSADLDGDGRPDLITADFNTNQISVLLNRTKFTPLISTTVALTSSQNPIQYHNSLVLTAQLTPTSINGRVPIGIVIFFDGDFVLGIGHLNSKGIAKIATRVLAVGSSALTARYEGDGIYHLAVSAILHQTVVTAADAVVLLSPTITGSFASPFLPPDVGTVHLNLLNTGAGTARGAIGVQLFASADGQLDSSAIPLSVTPAKVSVGILGGSSKSVTLRFKIPTASFVAGQFTIFAVLSPAAGLTADQFTATSVSAALPLLTALTKPK